MNLHYSKLIKFVSFFLNLSNNLSKFIKRYDSNKLDKTFCVNLLKEYINSDSSDLYIYTNNFKYIFGLTFDTPVTNSCWDSIYLKIIQDYADTYNECISPQYQVSVFHKVWLLNKNHINSWVSASNNNILNLLTSLTLLDTNVSYVTIEFKHFKSIKLFPGQTLTFPSNFEYSYRAHLREQSVRILFSQVLINPN